jgi:hypothetical protein
VSFVKDGAAGNDLVVLVRLVEAGRLTIPIGWYGPIDQLAAAADAQLRDLQIIGKGFSTLYR